MKRIITLMLVCIQYILSQSASITLNSRFDGVNQLSINDFNLLGQENIRTLFTASINLSGFSGQTLALEMYLNKDGENIFTGKTNSVTPNNQTVNFTSNNLAFVIPVQGTTGLDFSFTVNSDANFKTDQTLPTLLPNGKYEFTIKTIVNGSENNKASVTFHLNNQWQITLSSPFNWESVNNRPFFQWFSPSPFKGYKLYVWEVMNPGSSDDEIRNSIPVFEGSSAINSPQFTYPADASPLIPGKTYAWTVTGIIKKLSGNVEIPTSINKFVFTKQGNGSSINSVIDDLLRQLLMNNYNAVKKDLTGFSPTGIIKINGKEIKASDVGKFIDAVQSGEKRIEVEVN